MIQNKILNALFALLLLSTISTATPQMKIEQLELFQIEETLPLQPQFSLIVDKSPTLVLLPLSYTSDSNEKIGRHDKGAVVTGAFVALLTFFALGIAYKSLPRRIAF